MIKSSKIKKKKNVKAAYLIFKMLQWHNSLCVSIILLIASLAQDISNPCKTVENPMGGKHKDGIRRGRRAAGHENRQSDLHPADTVYTKHSGTGSFFKDLVLSPF